MNEGDVKNEEHSFQVGSLPPGIKKSKSRSSNFLESISAIKPMTEKDAENLDCFFREVAISPGVDEVKWHEPGQWVVYTPIYVPGGDQVKRYEPGCIPYSEPLNYDPKLYTPGPIMIAARALAPESSSNDS